MPAITVTQPYVVVVSNDAISGVGIIFNDFDAVPADGGQEWLCSLDILGVWTRSYDVEVGVGVLFDSDALFYPLVSYTMDSDFAPSADCFTGGPAINFTNNSSPIIQDRMYNLAAFLNLTSLSYTWDFGDGGGGNAIDTMNTYANTALDYTVYLTDTLYGWTSTCVDVDSTFIGNDLNALWSSVPAGAGVVNFTDNSTANTSINSWLWDFGDGNTSTSQNPSHTYATSGNYTVCLTTSTACGTDSTCSIVTVSTIGLLDLEGETFVAYPNPANNVLNIQSAQNIVLVEMMDMTGRLVVSNEYNTTAVEVKTSQLAEGRYTLRALQADGEVKITSIEVIH